ncbi:MAG TPA: electron transfer flavoprotein subunit beta/FixA family protein [Candidatus Avacidaminococcus intestinavium]|uniref:Electron transfer flavoprotein small subunit n=1 Tax=Candidatus Avacidaminococcus intestinavium TaxID=2840684 RepID=A0A9D1SKE5_9FIRM|nr:electron transfer flavoprotein subunit beta/FixA family protein [Candidatus Avacidaminococcus intestinavium]
MNIVVCLKQVPDTSEVRINPETNTLVRTGVPNIMNPFDRHALEAALILKDASGGEVTVVTMGPPQAEEIIKEAIAMGADNAFLVTDRALAGSDTLATSFALAAAVRKVGEVDLVLCGKQAIDGDTAQVGPEMAEHLDFSHVTGALKITKDGERLLVERENETHSQTVAVNLPALITVSRAEKEPRFASIKGKMKAKKFVIPVLSAAELGLDLASIGLSGSPTKVKKIFTPQVQKIENEIITESDPQTAVDLLVEKLIQAKIIVR